MSVACLRPYSDAFSPEDQSSLEENIQQIIDIPCNRFHGFKILYLILVEWGEYIYPNPYLSSMIRFGEDLDAFIYLNGDFSRLNPNLDAESILFFCINYAFPQFIRGENKCHDQIGTGAPTAFACTVAGEPFRN